MTDQSEIRAFFCVCLVLASGIAGAQNLKTGESVFREICSTCHVTGVGGAPKFGDSADWQPLISMGQVALTAEAWPGVRRMPPKGGRENLRLEEFARAVAYMARAVEANWPDPDVNMLLAINAEENKSRAAPGRK